MKFSQQEIKFLKESLLFEEFEKLCFPQELKKQAGLFEAIGLPSVGSFLKDFADRHIKDSSETPGGYVTSIVNILSPAVLFRINPILGALYVAFSLFGFNISDMAIKLAKGLKSPLEEKGSVLPEEVNSVAASIFGGTGDLNPAQDGLYRSAEDNTISEIVFEELIREAYIIKELDKKENSLTKEAQSWIDEVDNKGPATPFLRGGGKNVPVIQRIFGNLFDRPQGAKRLRWFGVGIVVWLLKTLLAGAGLLAVGALVGKFLGAPEVNPSLKDDSEESKSESDSEPKETKSQKSEEEKPSKEDKDKKDKSSEKPSSSNARLEVTLQGNGSIKDTLRFWALESYMEELYTDTLDAYLGIFKGLSRESLLKIEEQISKAIVSSSDFRNLVKELTRYKENNPKSFNPESNRFLMPEGYTSRLQAVDKFIDQVKNILKEQAKKT